LAVTDGGSKDKGGNYKCDLLKHLGTLRLAATANTSFER
jgi:hypothetical protein